MISTAALSFNKERRTLLGEASELGIRTGAAFPLEVMVRSAHTGRVIRFAYDHAAAERNEWWDGEQAEYIPVEHCNVERLVIIND